MQLSNFICLSILAVTAQSALLPRIFNDTAPCNTTNTTAFFPTIEKRGFGELPSNHTFPTNGTNSSHSHPHPHPNHPPHHQPRELTPLEVDNMIKKRFAEEAALRKFSDSL
ncbi:hypothetical protein CLIB1444_05S07888 [[Candida] jaroonii]|uniref:Uncharacterized protein n=1 Tax=[Candida] jaroonii TaxID=467808 RepID=A0ACA9Y9C4_9ASCO|nr:hypothetical protein CLIB1444_05S07888 [[Candida] jaroonii]